MRNKAVLAGDRCRSCDPGWPGLLGAIVLGLASSLLFAADCGRGPDATLDITPWTDNGDGTLGDENAQLMWKQCPEGLKGERCKDGLLEYLTWEQALKRAKKTRFAGFDNWRIPKLDELQQLIQPGCELPAVNLAAFPNTPSGWFWFDSAEANNSPRAGQLGFAFDEQFSANQHNVVNLRLVRDLTPAAEPSAGNEQPTNETAAEPDGTAIEANAEPVDGQPAAAPEGDATAEQPDQTGAPDQNAAAPAVEPPAESNAPPDGQPPPGPGGAPPPQ